MSEQSKWSSQYGRRPENVNATAGYQYQTVSRPNYTSLLPRPSGQVPQPTFPHSLNDHSSSTPQTITNRSDSRNHGAAHHEYAPSAHPQKRSPGPATQRQGPSPQYALLNQPDRTFATEPDWVTNASNLFHYHHSSPYSWNQGHSHQYAPGAPPLQTWTVQTPSWDSPHQAGPVAERSVDAQLLQCLTNSAFPAPRASTLGIGGEPGPTYNPQQRNFPRLPISGLSGEQSNVKPKKTKREQMPQADAHRTSKRKRIKAIPPHSIVSLSHQTAVLPTTVKGGSAPAGTQGNPLVLDMSPEPESRSMSKARTKSAVKQQPPNSQSLDIALTGSYQWKAHEVDWYGNQGGNNPSAHTDWDEATKYIKAQGSKPKRFPNRQEAQAYVDAGPAVPTAVSGATKSKTSSSTEPPLCKEQQNLVDLIMSGRNVFYTGSAGCGKSTVLKAFVKRFKELRKEVKILAPTGRAALAINGTTTWSYVGWVPSHHKKPIEELTKAAHGKLVHKRLTGTDVLVIDEISMVENHHLERINEVMKVARNNGRAFGGVQVIVTGDFCQLPPVKPFQHCITCGSELSPMDVVSENKRESGYRCKQHGIYLDKDKWAFRSRAWKECNFVHVNLTNIHRQSDKVFIDILQKLRLGRPLSSPDVELILNHPTKGVNANAVRLFGTRSDCNRVNFERFSRLVSRPRSYKCLDDFRWNEQHYNLRNKGEVDENGSLRELNRNEHRYNSTVDLKQGMAVVLLANIDIGKGLVNGAQGIIQGFERYNPNLLPSAGAPSAGKPGMPGMAGSPGFTPSGSRALVGEYAEYREDQIRLFMDCSEVKELPKVRFHNGECTTIHPDCSVNEYGDTKPYTTIARTQIPLTAGYAITTHKSQGMTLDKVEVDLSRTFEAGQAYVALSRARSLEGLKVTCFPETARCSANPEVQEFLREHFPESFVTD